MGKRQLILQQGIDCGSLSLQRALHRSFWYFLFSVNDSIKQSCQNKILMIMVSEKFSAVVLQWKTKPKAEAFLK